MTDKPTRSIKNRLLGIENNTVLEFELEIIFTKPLSDYVLSEVKSWLFGASGTQYKKLYIIKEDISDVYFNALLVAGEDYWIDGNNGLRFTVVCDSPGAWQNPKTYTWTFTGNPKTYMFLNRSADGGYTYPKLVMTMPNNAAGNNFTIINKTDSETRAFTFGTSPSGTQLIAGDVITVDCEKETITSNATGTPSRFANFTSKNFLRLKRGVNELVMTGTCTPTITATFACFKRLGG